MVTYRESGVDIDAAEALVDKIKPLVRTTYNSCVLSDIGAFGGFFRPNWEAYADPVLVSSVDGVGTKLLVARDAAVYDTVGQDLVNHCVNDIAVCGAVPLFFLDYYSTGRLSVDIGEQVIRGFAHACQQNTCALIGGETAEMPGIYASGDFDLAGTVVGIVDRDKILDGKGVVAGDILIGLPSTGLHTNGYSLARRVLLSNLNLEDRPDELDGNSVGEEMLMVHRSYLRAIRVLAEGGFVKGLSHVTGGGIVGTPPGLFGDRSRLTSTGTPGRSPVYSGSSKNSALYRSRICGARLILEWGWWPFVAPKWWMTRFLPLKRLEKNRGLLDRSWQ